MIRMAISIPLFLVVISFVANVVLAMLLGLTYTTLTKESIVAKMQFDKVLNQDNVYIGHLYSQSGDKIGEYEIYGDQWRLDASFIKMKYWANVLGVESKYTLDRLEGRYKNVNDQNTKQHKSYSIEGKSITDFFDWFLDTKYGSSTYKDIKLNTLYTVLKSPTGLLVREKMIMTTKEESYMDKMQSSLGFDSK